MNKRKDYLVSYPVINKNVITGHECCHADNLTHFLGNMAIAIRNSTFTGYIDLNTLSSIFFVMGEIGNRGRGIAKYYNRCRFPSTKSESDRLIAMQIAMFLKRAYGLVATVDVQKISLHIVFTGREKGEIWIAFNDNPNFSGLNRAVLIEATGSERILDVFEYKPPINPDDEEGED